MKGCKMKWIAVTQPKNWDLDNYQTLCIWFSSTLLYDRVGGQKLNGKFFHQNLNDVLVSFGFITSSTVYTTELTWF